MTYHRLRLLLAFCLPCVLGIGDVAGQSIRVTVENSGSTGGTAVAPVFVGVHDGSFNLFDGGTPSSPNLEVLAEVGGIQGTIDDFNAAGGVGGGIFNPLTPGQSGVVDFTIDLQSFGSDPRLLLASMVLPSNDWFLSNENGSSMTADPNGGGFSLAGIQIGETRTFTVDRLYDAGTESEDFAFSAGNPLFGLPAVDASLGDTLGGNVLFAGTVGPGGTTTADFLGFANNPNGVNPSLSALTVNVTAVPEPSGLLACGIIACGACLRRRKSA